MWEKFPGRSWPRAIRADVGAPPRDISTSPLLRTMPCTSIDGDAEGSSVPREIASASSAGACRRTSSAAARRP